MPASTALALEREDSHNCMHNVIPNLAKLLKHARDIDHAYLCTARAVQIWKLPKEGPYFCGYRNIQMLMSVLVPQQNDAAQSAKVKLTVPELQDMIEQAWNKGFNAHGKILTGGIRGTRKYIGTSEAETLMLSRGVSCTGKAFSGINAWTELLDSVEAYFSPAGHMPTTGAVVVTTRSPLFLQRPNHSVTIVGLERTVSGKRCLLIFDPAWPAPSRMETLLQQNCTGWSSRWLLRRYKKTPRYLKRFKAFETLEIRDFVS